MTKRGKLYKTEKKSKRKHGDKKNKDITGKR